MKELVFEPDTTISGSFLSCTIPNPVEMGISAIGHNRKPRMIEVLLLENSSPNESSIKNTTKD